MNIMFQIRAPFIYTKHHRIDRVSVVAVNMIPIITISGIRRAPTPLGGCVPILCVYFGKHVEFWLSTKTIYPKHDKYTCAFWQYRFARFIIIGKVHFSCVFFVVVFFFGRIPVGGSRCKKWKDVSREKSYMLWE